MPVLGKREIMDPPWVREPPLYTQGPGVRLLFLLTFQEGTFDLHDCIQAWQWVNRWPRKGACERGEGRVTDVDGHPKWVAKVFHTTFSGVTNREELRKKEDGLSRKRAKVRAMVQNKPTVGDSGTVTLCLHGLKRYSSKAVSSPAL